MTTSVWHRGLAEDQNGVRPDLDTLVRRTMREVAFALLSTGLMPEQLRVFLYDCTREQPRNSRPLSRLDEVIAAGLAVGGVESILRRPLVALDRHILACATERGRLPGEMEMIDRELAINAAQDRALVDFLRRPTHEHRVTLIELTDKQAFESQMLAAALAVM